MERLSERYDSTLRRAANDNRRVIFGSRRRVIGFVCECNASACYSTVLLDVAEFDAIRPGAVLAPGHA